MSTADHPHLLLVTGCYRSGTTLLEKLLHAHPQICIGAQPFSSLFWVVMEKFHRSIGIDRRYPLGHLFGERGYTPEDRDRFLDKEPLSEADLDRVFSQLEPNEAFTSARIRELSHRIDPAPFITVLRRLMALVDELHPKDGRRVIGAKEIVCEEFLPFLLGQGIACVIIVRDPRDVVASTHFRERGHYTGKQRPVLYTLRIWRKSVAFAVALSGSPGFSWIRYEDLVTDPLKAMSSVTSCMGLAEPPAETLEGELLDQAGNAWKANSSFGRYSGVTAASVGSHREHVPEGVTRYVETACLPEMRLLGYSARFAHAFDPDVVRQYRDPVGPLHPSFEPGYSSDPARVAAEIARLETLQTGHAAAEDLRANYLFTRTYTALRDAISRPR